MATGGQKLAVASCLTLLTCLQGLLMEGSKVNGKYPYNVAVIPLLAEFTKLCVSGFVLQRQLQRNPKTVQMTTDWRGILLFPIPSIIYLVHNNVQFYTMAYVDAATYQILGNLKIVTTGLLFRVILRRSLTQIQWLALLLLMCGAATSQVQGCTTGCVDRTLSAPLPGYLLGLVSAILSGTAGVYTEFLMKKNNDNLYWQNVQLYFFGTLFNAMRLTFDDMQAGYANGSWLTNATQGFSIVTWLIVLNFSFAGLFVSWIQKHADTIVKVYATSCAMMVTAVLSMLFFNLQPTLQLFLGIAIASVSLQLYFLPADIQTTAKRVDGLTTSLSTTQEKKQSP